MVSVLVAVGLVVTLLDRTHSSPAGSPKPTASLLAGPPYPVDLRTDDKTTATRAVGTWIPVWIAGYDGPLAFRKDAPQLGVQALDADPYASGGFAVTGRAASCAFLGGGRLSDTGELIDHSVGIPLVGCLVVGDLTLRTAFGAAFTDLTRLGVSSADVLTIYGQSVPLAQFVPLGGVTPDWSADSTLPVGAVGAWSVVDAESRTTAPLGGMISLTLTADGRYTGYSRCDYLSGGLRIGVDGRAKVSAPKVQTHPCPGLPSALRTTGSMSDIGRVGHFGNYLTLYDKQGYVLANLEAQLPLSIVGTWRLQSVGQTVDVPASASRSSTKLVLGDNGRLTGSMGCNRLEGSYRVQGDGRAFFSLGTESVGKCLLISVELRPILMRTVRMSVVDRRLMLNDGDGNVLATLTGVP